MKCRGSPPAGPAPGKLIGSLRVEALSAEAVVYLIPKAPSGDRSPFEIHPDLWPVIAAHKPMRLRSRKERVAHLAEGEP